MIVIAVDGTAASGKGTLAKKLARHYRLAHLDSGALYRAVALSVLRQGKDPADEQVAETAARSLDAALTEDPAIRTAEVGTAASIVAAIPAVRAALVDRQRQFASAPPAGCAGAIMDGRDIGTVICPHADVKIFVDADDTERARRRFLELQQKAAPSGEAAPDEAAVLDDIRARDLRDKTRSASPLKPADDAYLLDTSNLSIEATFEAACDIVDRVLNG